MTIKIFVNSTNKQSFVQAIIYLFILLRLKDDKIELFFYSNNISEPLNNLIKKIDDLKKLLISSNEYENIFYEFFGFIIERKDGYLPVIQIKEELNCLFNTDDKDLIDSLKDYNETQFIDKELCLPDHAVIVIGKNSIRVNNKKEQLKFKSNLDAFCLAKKNKQQLTQLTMTSDELDKKINNSIEIFMILKECSDFIKNETSGRRFFDLFSKNFSKNFNDLKENENKEKVLRGFENIIDFVFSPGNVNDPGITKFLKEQPWDVKLDLKDSDLKTKLISYAKEGNSFLQCVYKTVDELGYLK